MTKTIDKFILASLFFFLVIGVILGPMAFGKKTGKKTIIHSVSTDQIRFIRAIDKKYQKQHGINIKLKKKLTKELLGQEIISDGQAWFNKGKMRVEFSEPKKLIMVADGDYFWVEEHPPKDTKGGKVHVIKATLDSKRAQSQGLIQMLTGGKILKYFKVVGVKKEGPLVQYFLQPERQSMEFKRAQLTISKKEKEITGLRYWDDLDNETFYTFETTKFNQSLDKKLFNYKIPKGADVTTF